MAAAAVGPNRGQSIPRSEGGGVGGNQWAAIRLICASIHHSPWRLSRRPSQEKPHFCIRSFNWRSMIRSLQVNGVGLAGATDPATRSCAYPQNLARRLGRQRMAAQELGQGWSGLAQLPAVTAFLVALVPAARIGDGALSGGTHASSLPRPIAASV
jgi:hypothetical protein